MKGGNGEGTVGSLKHSLWATVVDHAIIYQSPLYHYS